MKKLKFYMPLLLIAAASSMFTSCKKEDSTDDSVSAEDNSAVSSGLNSTTDDVANAVGESSSISGKTNGLQNICGADVVVDSINGIATITFNGNDCSGHVSRTGTITATLENFANGTRWRDAGATLQMDFSNVKITNNVTGAYYTINGTQYLTNVTGGLAWRIMDGLDQGTVTHKHSADNFNLTFADGTQRTWSVRRSRSFSNDGSVRTVTLTGDTTINGISGIEAWGTNRNGGEFYGALIAPLVSNSSCGFLKPVSGEYTHHIANRSVDVLYGVDQSGNQITSGCAYGFKITYTKRNRTATRIVSYWF